MSMNITPLEAQKILSRSVEFEKFVKTNSLFFEKILNYSKSKNHFPHFLDKEDLMQEIYLSLHKALRKFNNTRASFSTFAWIVIKNDLSVMKNSYFKKTIFRETDINLSNFTKEQFIENIEFKKNIEDEIIEDIDLNDSLSSLSKLFENILREKIQGRKNSEIAEYLNMNLNTFTYIYKNHFLPKIKEIIKVNPSGFARKYGRNSIGKFIRTRNVNKRN